MLLAWEGINGFLPEVLQKLSVLYYLQSLCPVPAPMDETRRRSSGCWWRRPRRPRASGRFWALLLTALVLWIAGLAVRRMQISYGTDT